jgi:hypothetical protein
MESTHLMLETVEAMIMLQPWFYFILFIWMINRFFSFYFSAFPCLEVLDINSNIINWHVEKMDPV